MRSLALLVVCFSLGCPQPQTKAPAPAPGASVTVEIGSDGAKVETKK